MQHEMCGLLPHLKTNTLKNVLILIEIEKKKIIFSLHNTLSPPNLALLGIKKTVACHCIT